MDYCGAGEQILVVDDDEIQRQIACSLLSRLGYSVSSVSSGELAIDYILTHPVDLVILDMIMGSGMNGFETYQQIIAIRPELRALIASGFSETDEVKNAQLLGAGQFVKKPYTLEAMGMAVSLELRGQG
jgi:CheY-like chemotaxis protein